MTTTMPLPQPALRAADRVRAHRRGLVRRNQPDPSVERTYDYAAWYDLIRRLQPQAAIMGKGPDVRWVGTEAASGRTTEWSVIPLPTPPEQFNWPDWRGADLGSRSRTRQLPLVVPGRDERDHARQRQWFLGPH